MPCDHLRDGAPSGSSVNRVDRLQPMAPFPDVADPQPLQPEESYFAVPPLPSPQGMNMLLRAGLVVGSVTIALAQTGLPSCPLKNVVPGGGSRRHGDNAATGGD